MSTPYEAQQGWQIDLERYGTTIFMNIHDIREGVQDEMARKASIWGYTFETFCCKEDSSIGVDEEFCGIFKCQLGKHRYVIRLFFLFLSDET